jgi:hypothetical protein
VADGFAAYPAEKSKNSRARAHQVMRAVWHP